MGSLSHDSPLSPLPQIATRRKEPTSPGYSDTPPAPLPEPQTYRPLVFHAETSSSVKKLTFEPVLESSGVISAPTYLPDALKPPVHEVHETIDQHAELKGAEATALLSESSPAVAIAYELAKRGWLTIDHAHQIYLGLNFGSGAMGKELRELIPQRQSTTPTQSTELGKRLTEKDACSVIEALLPVELQALWTEVFRDARMAKYTEDTGSYLYLRPKHTPLAKHPISDFSLQVISLSDAEELPREGKSAVVVAKVGNDYHARIFDKRGRILFGKDGTEFTPDSVQEVDSLITERLTNESTGNGFPASDAEILDGVAASILLAPITFEDLFRAAQSEPEHSPLKKLTRSALAVERFNARARVPDEQVGEPDPALSVTEANLSTDSPFPGTHSGPILSGLSLREAMAGLEILASRVGAERQLGECELVWISKSSGTLTLGASSDGEEPESIRASSTSRHVLRPSLAASRINPRKKVMQQVDCLFPHSGEAAYSWNDLITNRASPVCSMQLSLLRALDQAPLARLEKELPILRDNVKTLIITPASLSQKKEATLTNVAHSLRNGTGAHEVEFLTYEEAIEHQLRAPSRDNPSPENKVRGSGLVVLLDPGYGKKGDPEVAHAERNLFFRLALAQQINATPPTAFPFDTLQQTLIVGSREERASEDPSASATTVLWQLLASVFDAGMMKNPPTIRFLDETIPQRDRPKNGGRIEQVTYPDGLPRLSVIGKAVRRVISTADAKPQGVVGHYQFTTCDLLPPSAINQHSSQRRLEETVTVLPLAGLGSATQIVPDAELQRTKGYWKAALAGLQGTEEHAFPLARETFIQFFTRSRFPLTELEGLRFAAIREGDVYRIGDTRLSEEQFRANIATLSGSPEEREDILVRRLLDENEVALLDEGSHLCNIVVTDYPRGIPLPRDGAGAKPDGRFNENTMSLFSKRIVPFRSPRGTLCFLQPIGVTTDPLARVEGIGEKPTAHGQIYFANNIDTRTSFILGPTAPGGAPILIDAEPGGVGTAEEIFSALGNIMIVEKEPGDPLTRLFCAERERQNLPYTLIPAGEPIEPYIAAALQGVHGTVGQNITWDELIRDFPVWDTGVEDLLS